MLALSGIQKEKQSQWKILELFEIARMSDPPWWFSIDGLLKHLVDWKFEGDLAILCDVSPHCDPNRVVDMVEGIPQLHLLSSIGCTPGSPHTELWRSKIEEYKAFMESRLETGPISSSEFATWAITAQNLIHMQRPADMDYLVEMVVDCGVKIANRVKDLRSVPPQNRTNLQIAQTVLPTYGNPGTYLDSLAMFIMSVAPLTDKVDLSTICQVGSPRFQSQLNAVISRGHVVYDDIAKDARAWIRTPRNLQRLTRKPDLLDSRIRDQRLSPMEQQAYLCAMHEEMIDVKPKAARWAVERLVLLIRQSWSRLDLLGLRGWITTSPSIGLSEKIALVKAMIDGSRSMFAPLIFESIFQDLKHHKIDTGLEASLRELLSNLKFHADSVWTTQFIEAILEERGPKK